MVLGKVSMKGSPPYFDNIRARAHCGCSRFG